MLILGSRCPSAHQRACWLYCRHPFQSMHSAHLIEIEVEIEIETEIEIEIEIEVEVEVEIQVDEGS